MFICVSCQYSQADLSEDSGDEYQDQVRNSGCRIDPQRNLAVLNCDYVSILDYYTCHLEIQKKVS